MIRAPFFSPSKTDKLPWETINDALTSIEDLTALD